MFRQNTEESESFMKILHFELSKPTGDFKPMSAVNNGPAYDRNALCFKDRTNFDTYRAAKIPFARNHDASFCPEYGGDFTVDISAIFPDFDADVNDPASYDCACTDEYTLVTLEAGTETFFRLGQRIEHEIRKHRTLPPKDFGKWVEICEHIIRHYNEGWANGFHYNIRYFEIWNEADNETDDAPVKRTWGGTRAQFFEFYETAAKHLKERFPDRKIGGPALAWREDWAEAFLKYMQEHNVPLDFFSWHFYGTEPREMIEKGNRLHAMMDRYGYGDAESILNEWNYVAPEEIHPFTDSVMQIHGLKGASFVLSCMAEAQKSRIDMLMYYDARPGTVYNGLFDFYSFRPLKSYYPIYWFGRLYGRKEIRCADEPEHLYTLCGLDENGKTLTLLTNYSDDEHAPEQSVRLDFGRPGTYEVYLLDETHDGVLMEVTRDLTFRIPNHTCLFLREK